MHQSFNVCHSAVKLSLMKFISHENHDSQRNLHYEEMTLNSSVILINLLKPTGYVTHQQFNIQQLYVLHTLYLCVLYLSENKQPLVPLTP